MERDRKAGTFYISGVGERRAGAITFLVEGSKVVRPHDVPKSNHESSVLHSHKP